MKQPEKMLTKRHEAMTTEPVHTPGWMEGMDRLFNWFWERGLPHPWRSEWTTYPETATNLPRIDVISREDEILLEAEIPGVEKNALEIEVDDDSVTLRGSRMHEEREQKENYYRAEIGRGVFTRTVQLPAEVDGARAKAAFNNGMLKLTLPRLVKAKRHTVRVD